MVIGGQARDEPGRQGHAVVQSYRQACSELEQRLILHVATLILTTHAASRHIRDEILGRVVGTANQMHLLAT